MKNILLTYYSALNLGDDLFVKVFSDYFHDCRITIVSPPKLVPDGLGSNVKVHPVSLFPSVRGRIRQLFGPENKLTKAINSRLTALADNCIRRLRQRSDADVMLGGSIFMEKNRGADEIPFDTDRSPDFSISSVLQHCGNSFVIGANLGPVFSQDYQDRMKAAFEKHNHVCLRDYASYCMVSDLPNVQYAPDVLFMVPQPLCSADRENVVISVIDISLHTSDPVIIAAYYTRLAEAAIHFAGAGIPVTLVSFCALEGDEKAIEKLLTMIPDHTNISTCFYSRDMDQILRLLSGASFIIGSRFHSIILGISFGKPVFPIMYNCKTSHYLSDLHFAGKSAKLEDLPTLTCDDIVYNYKNQIITDCRDHKEYSKNQFCGLQQYLDSIS